MTVKLRREKGKLKPHRSHVSGKRIIKRERPETVNRMRRKLKRLEKELKHAGHYEPDIQKHE